MKEAGDITILGLKITTIIFTFSTEFRYMNGMDRILS
jgi:hypothetical protein